MIQSLKHIFLMTIYFFIMTKQFIIVLGNCSEVSIIFSIACIFRISVLFHNKRDRNPNRTFSHRDSTFKININIIWSYRAHSSLSLKRDSIDCTVVTLLSATATQCAQRRDYHKYAELPTSCKRLYRKRHPEIGALFE